MAAKKIIPLSPIANITIPEHVEQEFLRSRQVCQYFNISESQLKKLRAQGIIPCYRLGQTYLYKTEEIIAQLEKVTPKNNKL